MTRRYNPDLDNVYVNRDGTIRWDGEAIGSVAKTDEAARAIGNWRAEVGDPVNPEQWPRWRVSFAKTRSAALLDVLDGIEAKA